MKPTTTIWHEGERALQQRLGMAERMAEVGPRIIRDFMPDQHREFFAQLPFVVIGCVDGQGDAWATLLAGSHGFVGSPDPRTLTIAATPPLDDPAGEGLVPVGSVGVLGIELHTRRRNRMNGTITHADPHGFAIAVEHSFGNCPKYIHLREAVTRSDSTPGPVERFVGLDARARAIIQTADTLFVASYVDRVDGSLTRQVDVSHRGGPAGFVQIDAASTLTIPDYAGNRFFNTLGNIAVQPRIGLVFVDFATGGLLQITGEAELLLEGDPRLAGLVGAERAWTVRVRHGVHRPAAIPLRWTEVRPS